MSNDVTLLAYESEIRDLNQKGQSEQAIALCRHILHYYPKDISIYGQMAEAALEEGDLENALELFRRVLSADPENADAYIGLAIVLERQKLTEEAVWHLERAFELVPDAPEVRQELQRLYGETGQTTTRVKLTPGALARLYAEQGLYSRAIQEYEFLLRSSPNRYDLHSALIEATWRAGRVREAADLSQKLIEKLPLSLKANLVLGTALQESGVAEGAAFLEIAEALDPTNHLACEILGPRSPLESADPALPRYVEGVEPPPMAEPQVEELPHAEAEQEPPTQVDWLKKETAEPTPESADVDLTALTATGEKSALDLAREFFQVDESAVPSAPLETEPVAEEPPAEIPAPALESIPDQAAQPEEPLAVESQPEVPEAASDLPDWIRADQAVQAQAELPTEVAKEEAESEAEPLAPPAWMTVPREEAPAVGAELSPGSEAPAPAEPTAQAAEAAEDQVIAPSWATPPAAAQEPGKEESTPVPSWLQVSAKSAAAASASPAEPIVEEVETAAVAEEVKAPAESMPEQAPPVVAAEQAVEVAAEETPDTPVEITPAEPVEASTAPAEEQPVESAPAEKPGETAQVQPVEAHPSGLLARFKPTTQPEELIAVTAAEQAEQPGLAPLSAEEQAAEERLAQTAQVPLGPALAWAGAKDEAESEPGSARQAEPAVPAEEPALDSAAVRRQRTLKAAERLEQARFLRDDNRLKDALSEYEFIVQHAPRLVQQVILDLEEIITRPDAPVQAHRILGDAYTRVDRLSDAVERYRFVLENGPKSSSA